MGFLGGMLILPERRTATGEVFLEASPELPERRRAAELFLSPGMTKGLLEGIGAAGGMARRAVVGVPDFLGAVFPQLDVELADLSAAFASDVMLVMTFAVRLDAALAATLVDDALVARFIFAYRLSNCN